MGEVESKKDKVTRANFGMHDRHIPVVIDEIKEKMLRRKPALKLSPFRKRVFREKLS